MMNHVAAAYSGVQQKLARDLDNLRAIGIAHPDQVAQAIRYSKNCGSYEIPKGGTRIPTPDLENNKWLDMEEPNFSEIQGGFRYEQVNIRRNFHGPEEIKLSNGKKIVITP